MKKWFYTIAILLLVFPAHARHIAGGELFYEYQGPGSNSSAGKPTSSYKITLRLFRDCASTGPLLEAETVVVGIYSSATDSIYKQLPLPRIGSINTITLNTSAFPCLVGNVSVCYQIGIFSATIELEDSKTGYTLSRIGCCRINNISNLSTPTGPGSNYVTKIPGSNALPIGHNSSPQFLIKDTALVCANKPFTLDFGAMDPDSDSLSFALCDAYTSPSGNNNASAPPDILSLVSLPYTGFYTGNYPLGPGSNINAATGIISGIAPPEGAYVVNVCITEWRNGRPFSEHRKDFILKVQNCDFIEADLPDKIIQCNDFKVHFENGSTSAAITSYLWQFGNSANSSSTNPTVDFVYKDTGRYIASLTVTGPKGCIGSDSTLVLVYPGFKPGFTISGSCYQNPFQFTDSTITSYGLVNSWSWNFGDASVTTDTASTKNAKYTYPAPAATKVKLVVTNSKGCIDSLSKDLLVSNKPLLQLPFKDTLICSIDTLPISVPNSGNYSWSPHQNIINANTSSVLVFPKTTTQYIVQLTDNGCANTDTVTVRVLDFIKVNLGKDSTICATDSLHLQPVSDALSYLWKSSTGVAIEPVKYPVVVPLVNTQYFVTANLGKCQDRDTLFIRVVPYPYANAGQDTIICFGGKTQLQASIKALSFQWNPTSSLSNPNITNPVAIPSKSTIYILTVRDTLGCPKPFSDSVLVTVAPPIRANAGRDTAVLVNQPLQLNATGGIRYSWYPETGLNNASIANPIAVLDDRFDSVVYRVRAFGLGGCYADDNVLVKVFKTGPDIFVPSAFTPNGDGKNDVLRPITIGIATLKYFSVYNRWGQLLFTTAEMGKGWDGSFGNIKQSAGSYVFMTEGVDYLGKKVFRKGTAVLIR